MHKDQQQNLGSLYLFLAFSLAGSSVVAGKYLTGSLGVFTISAISLSLATLTLLPALAGQIRGICARLTGRAWLLLLCQALCGIFLFRLFMLVGLQKTSAAEAGILTGATPAISAILARLALREKVRPLQIAGIACTIVGIAGIQSEWPTLADILYGQASHLAGNLLVLLAAASESSFNVLARWDHLRTSSTAQPSIGPAASTAIVSAIAGLLCVPFAISERPLAHLASLPAAGWGALAWYGIVVTGIAFIFFYAGIRRQSAYAAAAFSGMIPLAAMVLAAVLLREPTLPRQWLGGGLVIAGILLLAAKCVIIS